MNAIENLLADFENRLKIATDEIKTLPEARLAIEKREKKTIVFASSYKNGRRTRLTITGNEPLQIQLARRMVLENEQAILMELEKRTKELSNFLKRHAVPDRQRYCIEHFPWMTDQMIKEVCTDSYNADAWESEEYEQSNYKPELRTKLTSHGLYVRSKSEVIIAEKLYEYHIPFHYEETLWIQKNQIVPDFTIKRKDGKIFYWEHEGMMTMEQYEKRQITKAALYRQMGIVPWDNLIITYDNAAGDIDVRIIEAEIRNKLLL